MAKNLAELEKDLSVLEARKKEQVNLVKNDVAALQQALKPGNLLKSAVKDLMGGTVSQGLMGGAAGIAGTLLFDGLFRKKSTALALAGSLLTSEPVVRFLKDDKLGLGKLADKLKSYINRKGEGERLTPEDEGWDLGV